MALSVKYFLVVKDGSPPEHNDDAASADVAQGRFAVSDGAAESGFSRIWSKLLVDQFVSHHAGSPKDWSAWLPEAQQRWLAELQGVEIPWYGERQFADGCVRHVSGAGRSRHGIPPALARGRGGRYLPLPHQRRKAGTGVPLGRLHRVQLHAQADRFAFSRCRDRGQAFRFRPRFRGTGDRLWLMSDALAKWCLAEDESRRPPWNGLASLIAPDSAADFAAWVDQLRSQRGLHNDNVTLMAIEL